MSSKEALASETNLNLILEEANLGEPFYVEQVTPTTVRVVDVNGIPRLEVSYTV